MRLTGLGFSSERRVSRLLRRVGDRLAPALRWAPPGLVRVAWDPSCRWLLGLAFRDLFMESLRRGVWLVPLGRRDLERCGVHMRGPASRAAIDAAEYQLCIRHEMLRDELAYAVRTSSALSEEFDEALKQAVSRESALERIATRVGFQSMVYMQGYRPVAAAMRGIAGRRGISTLALENTLFNDRAIWDAETGITCFTDRCRAAFAMRMGGSLAAVGNAESHGFECGSPSLKSDEHRSGCQPVSIPVPYVLFIGQVFTDAAILFGCLPAWGPLEVVSQVHRFVRGLGMPLVIKAHPKETKGKDPLFTRPYRRLFARRLRASVPEVFAAPDCVVDDDNSLDTYAAMRSAACVVTMNSQAGIEAAALGVPTIVCARSHYDDCGFTFDGTSEAALQRSIRACLTMPQSERLRMQVLASAFVRVLRDHVYVPKSAPVIAELVERTAKRVSLSEF